MGFYQDFTPPLGIARALAARGLLDVIEPDGFLGGTYQVNAAGREFVRERVPPVEW